MHRHTLDKIRPYSWAWLLRSMFANLYLIILFDQDGKVGQKMHHDFLVYQPVLVVSYLSFYGLRPAFIVAANWLNLSAVALPPLPAIVECKGR